MAENAYLKWLASTGSCWWCDSAVISVVEQAVENGATGVTTNPVLVAKALHADPAYWRQYMSGCENLAGDEKVEELMRRVTVKVAELLMPAYEASGGAQGYVCAQVNPSLAGKRREMAEMARRLHSWAPNIAVKLPGTSAGLDVMEDCAAEGITTVGTVSFTTAQAVEIARRQHLGALRAKEAGKKPPAAAFSVIMVGRLDDYLREVTDDQQSNVEPGDLLWAGLAAIKRAYAEVKRQGYASQLMPAAMRGPHHAVNLAGADMSMSIAENIQQALGKEAAPYAEHINDAIPADALARLETVPEFARASTIDGLAPKDFVTFGTTQRTLSQFIEAGWNGIKSFAV